MARIRPAPTLSQQWERAVSAREKALDRLIRAEARVRKLRKRLARRSRKDAATYVKPGDGFTFVPEPISTVEEGWDQSPLSDDLTDISMGV